MRILLISPLPPPIGGISRWTQIVLPFLKKENKVSVQHLNIAPKYKGKITIPKRVIYGIFSVIKTYITSYAAFKKGIDVVHITSSGRLALFRDKAVLRLAKRFHVRTVFHLHFGRLPELAAADTKEWKTFANVFQYCDAVVAIDKKTKNTLDTCGYREKSHYCPNPVDVNTLEALRIGQHTDKRIVYVGHVYPKKGVKELVEAWMNIRHLYPDYSLELIGSTAETEFIQSLPKDDSVNFVGEKSHEETMALLSQADALVLPSYSEGFPNVILEAMALKIPIIATKVGAIPEMLAEECGVLIDAKSVEQLQNALCNVLNSEALRKSTAEKAYKRVCEKYDIKCAIDNYYRIWKLENK